MRKLSLGLFKKAGQRLPAVALALIVRAEVEAIHMSAVALKFLLKRGVDSVHVGRRIQAQGNSALVGNHHHSQSGAVETGDSLGHARQEIKLPPRRNEAPFRHLFIQDSVAIKENGTQVAGEDFIG